MANTYTTGLKLSKPALGDAGWGTTVNGGFTDLVDQAVVGSVNVAVTSGGTTTLAAISDGASSDARNMSLAITGALTTGQTATVRVPATVAGITKLYSVANGAGGTVTVETSGGTSVAVPDGARMLLRVTSAGVSEAVNYVASLTLGTALPATSGGTGHSSYTVGDLLYASSTTALTKLTVGATGAVLTVAAGIPAWTPTIGVSSGGTGAASLAANNVLLGNGTSALQVVAPGTSGNVLASNGTTWASTAIGTLVPAATDTVSGVVELATNAEVQTGTDTTRAVTPASLRAGSLVRGTVQNSTSGTVVDFTGIPSWVKRITVMFNGVSTNGSSQIIFQLGTSSGFETSGYAGGGGFATLGTANSNGFLIADTSSASAAYVREGQYVFHNMTGNVWTMSGVGYGATALLLSSGTKSLGGVLDRVRVTTVNGTDTFDAGQINIIYE
jgi:hypothetical protein